MLLWLDHIVSRQAQTAGMATGTVARRTFEHSTHVTRLAPRGRVRSSQRKTSFQMVKFFRCILRPQICTHGQACKRQQDSDNAHKQVWTVWLHRNTPSPFGNIKLSALAAKHTARACRPATSTAAGLPDCPVRRWIFFQLSLR